MPHSLLIRKIRTTKSMEDQLNIPIPRYPPFRLRSMLLDKDPVIWIHFLEEYIELFQALLKDDVKLNVMSQQQLQLFLKVYLAETSEESSRIFSLGAINPDMKKKTASLRAYALQVIRDYGLVKLALTGESLWHFVIVYVEKNSTIVRGLLNGSLKAKLNDNKKSGKISLISPLREYLKEKIISGDIPDTIVKYLSSLVGQHTVQARAQIILVTGAGVAKPKIARKKKETLNMLSALQFSESFVNDEWIRMLEVAYAGGRCVNADLIRNVMVVSVLSLSTAKLASLVTTLGIHGTETMIIAPLFSTVIISDAYKTLCPGLEEKLPFVKNLDQETLDIKDCDIELLQDMFPNITATNAIAILLANQNDINRVINILLENPNFINDCETQELKAETDTTISATALENGLKRFSLKKNETTETVEHLDIAQSEEELKKRTLTHALRLLYDGNEDERDDTYDAYDGGEPDSRKRVNTINDLDDPELAPPEIMHEDESSLILFDYLKRGGDSLFARTARKKQERSDMKKALGWTNEQIEGWFRMLQRSPDRYRLFEEEYAMKNSKKATVPRATREAKTARDDATPTTRSQKSETLQEQTHSSVRLEARKEKNKATGGNRDRKNTHSETG